MNGLCSLQPKHTAAVNDDSDNDDEDDTLPAAAPFGYQRLPDTDDEAEADVDNDSTDNDTTTITTTTTTKTHDDDDDDDDDNPTAAPQHDFAPPVMRVDEAIVLAEARMPAVLPDDAYARFANQRGLISGAHELPPRPLEADLSNDDVADVLSAMSGLQLSYRPAWLPSSAQDDLASVDELVRQRTGLPPK
jgi:hypothetical protein